MPDGPPNRSTSRRRRSNAEDGPRRIAHLVKVTAVEEAELVVRAEQQRVSVPRLLVEAALADRAETPTARRDAMTELFAVRRALANTANNVNQMAYAANTTGELPFAPGDVIDELRERLQRIDDLIDRLSA